MTKHGKASERQASQPPYYGLPSLPEQTSGTNTWIGSSVSSVRDRRASTSELCSSTKQYEDVRDLAPISSSLNDMCMKTLKTPYSTRISTPLMHTLDTPEEHQEVAHEPFPLLVEGRSPIEVVNDGTPGTGALTTQNHAGTNTLAETAEERTKNLIAQRTSRTEAVLLNKPKYLRYNYYSVETPLSTRTTVHWSETAPPLPDVPPEENNNPMYWKTISDNPGLFRIVTPLKVDVFEAYLKYHPNQPFVQSVLRSLREGFWPYAKPVPSDYPTIHDMSMPTPENPAEAEFLRQQRDIEIEKGRFSHSFGHNLLPGMYSSPIHAVPKPKSTDLRLVTNQSFGEYSLNSLIPYEDICGLPLDNMCHFAEYLLKIRQEYDGPLVLWKSDVKEAYRLCPMHPIWQMKQIVTIDGHRHVDRCNCFGGRASMNCWCSVCCLVLWIAKHIKDIKDPFCFNDNSYGADEKGDKMYYAPYQKFMPELQAKFLYLCDELGVPHKPSKQVLGDTLTIIGIEVDPNAMTMTLNEVAKAELVAEMKYYSERRKHTKRQWQRLAVWVNWGLNVFPLAAPALANVYDKINGISDKLKNKVWCNNAITSALLWGAQLIENSSGVRLLNSLAWDDWEADVILESDACPSGLGYWITGDLRGFYCSFKKSMDAGLTFYLEALAVACAFYKAVRYERHPMKVIVRTDSANSVTIFSSLHAKPLYNPILRFVVDLMVAGGHILRVTHIPGEVNVIADHLSRKKLQDARDYCPGLSIVDFEPPRVLLGAEEK